VLGPDGQRLAKRHGSVTLADLAQDGTSPHEVRNRLAVSLRLAEPGEPVTMDQLLDRFEPAAVPAQPWVITDVG